MTLKLQDIVEMVLKFFLQSYCSLFLCYFSYLGICISNEIVHVIIKVLKFVHVNIKYSSLNFLLVSIIAFASNYMMVKDTIHVVTIP